MKGDRLNRRILLQSGVAMLAWPGVLLAQTTKRFRQAIIDYARRMPVEQLGRFELVVNLKTAREIGVTIPRSILVRADRIID